MKCSTCGTKITEENDGLFITETLLSFEEKERFKLKKKSLCISCKRDLFFANIISVI